MSNWIVGIDRGVSTPTNQIGLAGHAAFSPLSGSNATGDGSPDNPYLDLNAPIVSGIPTSQTWNLESGIYINGDQKSPQLSVVKIKANVKHQVIVKNDDPLINKRRFNTSTVVETHGIKFINGYWGERRRVRYFDCIHEFENPDQIVVNPSNAISGTNIFKNHIFINTGVRISKFGTNDVTEILYYENCTFIGTCALTENTNTLGGSYGLSFKNCDFSQATTLQYTDTLDLSRSEFINCNFRLTQTNTQTPGNIITDTGSINVDPQHLDTSNGKYLIPLTSPLIGAGLNGDKIGAFEVGHITDFTNPVENNNITVGSTLILTGASGNIKTEFYTLDQVRSSPIPKIEVLEVNDNIPKIEDTTTTPEYYTLTISYKSTIGGAIITKDFIHGMPMYLDDSGVSTGEKDGSGNFIFNWGDIEDGLQLINIIKVAEIQKDIKLINR